MSKIITLLTLILLSLGSQASVQSAIFNTLDQLSKEQVQCSILADEVSKHLGKLEGVRQAERLYQQDFKVPKFCNELFGSLFKKKNESPEDMMERYKDDCRSHPLDESLYLSHAKRALHDIILEEQFEQNRCAFVAEANEESREIARNISTILRGVHFKALNKLLLD